MILSGKPVAQNIYQELEKKISQIKTKPHLRVILVGNNPASLKYIEQKRKYAEKIGMEFSLSRYEEDISEAELREHIIRIGQDTSISGYITQLPLPKHINTHTIINSINPHKDVDGFHPENQGKCMIADVSGFLPCTPAGIMEILRFYNIELTGKTVCILGRSNIVGKPLSMLCINAGATVISCNSHTQNIENFTRQADIVISATGQARILSASMLKKNACVIDVGFNISPNGIRGDAQSSEILERGHDITPVPGGVGPMTVAMLLKNTYHAHLLQNAK